MVSGEAPQWAANLAGAGATVGPSKGPQPVLGTGSVSGSEERRDEPPGTGASASPKAIELPLPLMIVHVHRATLIPKVVDVSTILAERDAIEVSSGNASQLTMHVNDNYCNSQY